MPITNRRRPHRELRVVVQLRHESGASQRDGQVIERRMRLALARFGPLVRHARVELSSQGERPACRLELRGATTVPIVVIARGDAPILAFADAIDAALDELAARLRRGRGLVLRDPAHCA